MKSNAVLRGALYVDVMVMHGEREAEKGVSGEGRREGMGVEEEDGGMEKCV